MAQRLMLLDKQGRKRCGHVPGMRLPHRMVAFLRCAQDSCGPFDKAASVRRRNRRRRQVITHGNPLVTRRCLRGTHFR